MAVNKKITELTELAVAPAAGDLLPIVDVSDTTDAPEGTTKKITVDNLIDVVGAGDVDGPSSSVASEFALFDGTTGKLLKRATGSGFVKSTSGVYSTEANPTTGLPFEIVVACSDEDTPITTGTTKITFRMPRAVTLTAVRANLKTPAASGTFTVDINESGSTILSTKITIDATEKTSATAATPPVISDASLADDAEMTVDVDDDASGDATGLKITLIGTRA
jgi:hypothetical protein